MNDEDVELSEKLGIVEDLKEDKSTLGGEKAKVAFMALGLLGMIILIVYPMFSKSEDDKVSDKGEIVEIKEVKFEAPPPSPPKKEALPKKELKELPMTPFEEVKPKKVFKVTKGEKGSIINFAPAPKEETKKNNPNQVDVNFYNKYSEKKKQISSSTVEKKPQIYKGGDYAIAGISRQDPNLSLAKGAYIECTMVTRIVSSYSGNTKCITSEDIYSTNGVTLLIEKGSTVTGHFKGGSMENGIERLFVIWDEIRTPYNVVINIDSQATGTLGATGVEGYVDNHWGMRFGSAILVSILDIGAETVKSKYVKGDNYSSSGNAVKSLSSTALNQYINIKPTFYKNHGDVVGIYVGKYLDFSKVYRLK